MGSELKFREDRHYNNLITAFLSFRHGWSGITNNASPEEAKMLTDLGITKPIGNSGRYFILAVGLIVLFPQTFFIANVINAIMILLIMALSLRVGNIKTALIEIPFLLMALVLIWLGSR